MEEFSTFVVGHEYTAVKYIQSLNLYHIFPKNYQKLIVYPCVKLES